MKKKIIVVTRRSPLAMAQTHETVNYLAGCYPDAAIEIRDMVTTGDKKLKWSLEKQGGKGLFTRELEMALLEGSADLAVHSAKDLPTEMDDDLTIAGYLPREQANDVLVVNEKCEKPVFIATSSPRRRTQAKLLYPSAVWSEIRGNVQTRLKKIISGQADATILAAAGLNRLGIHEWPGIRFLPLALEQIVPAVGQGAIALQCRKDQVDVFKPVIDSATARAVTFERFFLAALGGGCQSAYAAHFTDEKLYLFHEYSGLEVSDFSGYSDEQIFENIDEKAKRLQSG